MINYIKHIFTKHALAVTLLLTSCSTITAHTRTENIDFSDVESAELLTARLKEIVIACSQKCKMPGLDKTRACTYFCVERELEAIVAKALNGYMTTCQGDTACAYQKAKKTVRRANKNLDYMIGEAALGRLK